LAQSSEEGSAQLEKALETLERAQTLNPLNPDHAANLSRFHQQAAALETDATARETHLHAADNHYAEALALAPQNVMLLNEWALLQWYLHGEAQACRLLERSLELDPEFEQTQQQYADICSRAISDQPQNLDFED
jgi:tetratricopeptide (TPR) repeat protein